MPDRVDLSLVAMDDMVAEIKKRFETVVILTRRRVDDNNDDLHYHFQDKVGVLGLLRIADNWIKNTYENKETGTYDE